MTSKASAAGMSEFVHNKNTKHKGQEGVFNDLKFNTSLKPNGKRNGSAAEKNKLRQSAPVQRDDAQMYYDTDASQADQTSASATINQDDLPDLGRPRSEENHRQGVNSIGTMSESQRDERLLADQDHNDHADSQLQTGATLNLSSAYRPGVLATKVALRQGVDVGTRRISGDSYPATTTGPSSVASHRAGITNQPVIFQQGPGGDGLASNHPGKHLHPRQPAPVSFGATGPVTAPSTPFHPGANPMVEINEQFQNMRAQQPNPTTQRLQQNKTQPPHPHEIGPTTQAPLHQLLRPATHPNNQGPRDTRSKHDAASHNHPPQNQSRDTLHHDDVIRARESTRQHSAPSHHTETESSQRSRMHAGQGDQNTGEEQYMDDELAQEPSSELDYPPEELRKMDFAALRAASFDIDPTLAESAFNDDFLKQPMNEKMSVIASQPPETQLDFFASLPIDQWENAGDWFLEAFQGVTKKLIEARRTKRKVAQKYENAIEERHGAVDTKRRVTDEALMQMRKSGADMLRGTPQRSTKGG